MGHFPQFYVKYGWVQPRVRCITLIKKMQFDIRAFHWRENRLITGGHFLCFIAPGFQTIKTEYEYFIFYRPQEKLREGNVFTGVCLFTGGGMSH